MANTLTWLHLSDLHMRRDALDDMRVVLDALWRDLPEQIEKLGGHLDFIAFTGDVAFSGKEEEYKLTEEHFFKPLFDTAKVSAERLFLVPGNHDVDWDLVKLINPDLPRSLNSREAVTALLGNDAQRRLMFQTMAAFEKFARRLCEGSLDRPMLSDPLYSYAEQVSATITPAAFVIGLNSAWLSGFAKDAWGEAIDQAHLLVGDKQIGDALRQTENATVRIALMHHPTSWLKEFDELDVQHWLDSGCDFVLRGHLHVPNFIADSALGGDTITIPAGSIYKNRDRLNGYNLVQLNFGTGKGQILLRRYSEERHEWVKDIQSTGDRLDGEVTFGLPGRLMLSVPKPVRPITLAETVLSEIEPTWLRLGRERETQLLEAFLEREERSTLWIYGDPGCGLSEFLLVAEELLRRKNAEVIRFDAQDTACGIPMDQRYFLDRLEEWARPATKDADAQETGDVADRLQRLTQRIADRLTEINKPLVLVFANTHLLLPTVREWVLSTLWCRLADHLAKHRPRAILACEGAPPASLSSIQENKIQLAEFTVSDIGSFLNTLQSIDPLGIPDLARRIHSGGLDRFLASPRLVYQNLVAAMVRGDLGWRPR